MKLDIKARLRNKYFWISFISLVVMLLEQLGIKLPFDLNAISRTIPIIKTANANPENLPSASIPK